MVKVVSSLLQLPVEIHLLIIEYLPLSANILYQTQVCSTLRRLFGGRLKLSNSYRFDLVEWNLAERDIREILQRQDEGEGQDIKDSQSCTQHRAKKSIWDTSPESTPRPAPAKLTSLNTSHLSPLLADTPVLQARQRCQSGDDDQLEAPVHGKHPDLDLFIRCLQMLGKMEEHKTSRETRHESKEMIILSLLSRSGFRVAPLIQLLESQPCLRNIETILMTFASSIDAVLWTLFTPPRKKHMAMPIDEGTRSNAKVSSSTCVDTQAIVIPSPHSQRGHGLRSGFKCLCFNHSARLDSPHNQGNVDDQATTITPFPVIFHDWYDEEEARGTQDMLENSDITCNTCKHNIRF